MNLESWKRWQWALIGAIAGALIGWGEVSRQENERVGGEGFITQIVFEQEFLAAPVEGRPRLKNFSIHRSGDADVVEMERIGALSAGSGYVPIKFAAPYPYRPLRTAGVRENYTVRQFMQDAAEWDAKLVVNFAWWREPWPRVGLWALGGIVVLGGIWPSLVKWLVGAGWGRAVKEKMINLDQFKSEPENEPAGPTPEQQAHLKQLEEEMAAGMQQQGTDVAASPSVATAAVVKKLDGEILAPAASPHEDEKHYKGQYYPVAMPEGHDEAPKPKSGFTLIELMVVIGIIGLLIAILLPTLQGAKLRGQQVKCMGQLQQIGQALHMYANDNGGWLPEWSMFHTWPRGQTGDSPGAAWTEEMAKYLGPPDKPIYNCPSWPGPFPCRNYFLEARWSGLSGQSAMKLSDIRMTSRFVLSGDKTQRGGYPEPFGTDPRHPIDDSDPDDFGRSGNPQLTWPWQGGGFYMHRGGNNVLFDDGHVALFGRYDPTAMTFHPTRMQDWADVTPGMGP